jgi:hypothetical protein
MKRFCKKNDIPCHICMGSMSSGEGAGLADGNGEDVGDGVAVRLTLGGGVGVPSTANTRYRYYGITTIPGTRNS